MEIDIEVYETAHGACPYEDWFDSLRENRTQAKIATRLDRLKMGNFGNCKPLGDGISELRIDVTAQGSGFTILKRGTLLSCFSAAETKDRRTKT